MEDKQDWEIVYKSSDLFDMELIQARLKEINIESIIFNHQDSMIKMLNDTNYGVGLYVHKDNVERAKELIDNQ